MRNAACIGKKKQPYIIRTWSAASHHFLNEEAGAISRWLRQRSRVIIASASWSSASFAVRASMLLLPPWYRLKVARAIVTGV